MLPLIMIVVIDTNVFISACLGNGDMYQAIEAVGGDVDPRSHIRTGSILIGRMTVAGGGEGS